MSLRIRLLLLIAMLTLLPALPAAWVTRDLLGRSVELGLREEIDTGLQSGVRQARAGLQVQRESLRDEVRAWQDAFARAGGSFDRMDISFADPTTRAVLDGEVILVPGVEELARAAVEQSRNAPPLRISETFDLGPGRIVLTRAVDEEWREDALRTSESLQMLRSLRAERASIERGFLAPFVMIYAAGLLLAALAAWLVARGLTGRVDRLVRATDRVAEGDWEVQVGLRGEDELARLGHGFDRMVRTLDAQSRHLVEMETMAGWREMARALAHEVKNPLTPIQLTVEEMRERYRGDDAEYAALLEECTRIVVEEVDSLREVVGRFRDFSRPVELELEAVDLNALLRDIGAMQKDLGVELALDEGLPPALADADRLRQVLMNLASNAREATARTADPRLRLGTRVDARGVALSFEDNGPGIAVADREHVFEPYRTGRKTGLGLGLALVKGIILAHEGSIEVDAGPLGGARFTIVLPTAPEEGA